MENLAFPGGALCLRHVPGSRGGGDHEHSDRGAGATQRSEVVEYAAAAACATRKIGLNYLDPAPIEVCLVGQNHWKCGVDSLAHLGLGKHKLGAVVRVDLDPGVEGIFCCGCVLTSAFTDMERPMHPYSDHQRTCAGSGP